ncbi:sulfatase-like hydrolase/transferase [Roseibacillus persicicus]|uniref:sulfatase family protein n=1 Tax=Roseibacillus persicicus TaxID=454148 RepID=UPI00398AA1B2
MRILSSRPLSLSLSLFLSIFVRGAEEPVLEGKRPNIVVILCDDLGYGDLECYGHPHIKTPHLNALAESGIRFTDFYSAAPVCSPSRVGLMTGRNPNRAGVYDFIPGNKDIYLRASEVTFPQLLKKAGYATCLSGKWHCNGKFNNDAQPQPDAAGFDHWFATQNNASPSHANPRNYVRNGEEVGALEGYSCQIATDEALGWIEKQQKADAEQPFFLYLAFHEPHEPIASPESLVKDYREDARQEEEALYFANVANVDAAVGRLQARLAEMGLTDDTLVIFSSDNGPETLLRYQRAKNSFGSAAPLRGMKLWTTEAGFRVPGIMSWPGVIAPKQTEKAAFSCLDFFPTFLELAGAEVPRNRPLDGTSLLPYLGGRTLEREKPLLWVFYNALNERRVAMRHGDWKLMAKLNLPRYNSVNEKIAEKVKSATLSDFQLFNLTSDVHEANDLSGEKPGKLAELKTLLEKEYAALVADSHVWDAPKAEAKKAKPKK